ncbi:MAG: hypothetical protein KF862_12750 [Chitinophagaceae bacterium]|nr:hypothetical protein [Chitinophagaceae bacterium]
MKKKLKLAFENLDKELTPLTVIESMYYKGSSGGPTISFDWSAIMALFNSGYDYYETSGSSTGTYSSGFNGSTSTGTYSSVPHGFSLLPPNYSGVSQLSYGGQSFNGTLGMQGSKLTLEINWNDWYLKAAGSIPGYGTKPNDLDIPSIPGTGTPYTFGIKFTL